MKTAMGNYLSLAMASAEACTHSLSFLAKDWPEVKAWQIRGRAKVLELLSYSPEPCPLNASVDQRYTKDGLMIEHVSYDQPFGPRTEGILLYPIGAKGKLPGVVALHDHGGFKYYGKEKLVDLDDEPDILTEFKRENYDSTSWATKLAKQGYVVFVPDIFLWGSRKLAVDDVPETFVQQVLSKTPGSRAYIEAYNDFSRQYESVIAKSLYLAGATWTGIMAYEDRRAVDYLLTRPEVDEQRLGCGGLSGGGLRTIFLSGLDDRIKCAVCVGFMSTNKEVVAHRITEHTWMLHVPHLAAYLDMPDLISLHGPQPLMVQYAIDDHLWTLKGQQEQRCEIKKYIRQNGCLGHV